MVYILGIPETSFSGLKTRTALSVRKSILPLTQIVTNLEGKIHSKKNTLFGLNSDIKLDTVVPRVVSVTVIPITRPSVNKLFTSGLPYSVSDAL